MSDTLNERIGYRVKFLRRNADLSQAELAKISGLSQSAIAKIETGDGGMSLETLYSIEEILGDVWNARHIDEVRKNNQRNKRSRRHQR